MKRDHDFFFEDCERKTGNLWSGKIRYGLVFKILKIFCRKSNKSKFLKLFIQSQTLTFFSLLLLFTQLYFPNLSDKNMINPFNRTYLFTSIRL